MANQGLFTSFHILKCYHRSSRKISGFNILRPMYALSMMKHWCSHKNKCEFWTNDIPVRCFFNLPGMSKKKEYSERKLVGYSMEQMYSVVSDVKNYKAFIPFCKRSNILSQSSGHLKADLVIGFPPIRESYISNVTLVRPQLVRAECTDGKLFNHLLTVWKFSPGLKNDAKTCIIDFRVSFEFRSALHSHLAHVFFNELVRQMENAFLQEAARRYGRSHIQYKLK